MTLVDRLRVALGAPPPPSAAAPPGREEEHRTRLAQLRRELDRIGRRYAATAAAPSPRPPAPPPSPLPETTIHEHLFPAGHRFGREATLRCPDALLLEAVTRLLELEAGWPADAAPLAAEELAFLDIESTGLSRSAGTLAFLIGVGRFVDGGLEVVQILLRDPAREPDALAELARRLEAARALVSFNGRAFDVPVLRNRALLCATSLPLDRPHLDLLPVARRLYRARLQSCRLGSLERHVFRFEREGDVDGAEAPRIYRDFLRTGRGDEIAPLLEHNRLDVAVLAALLEAAALHVVRPLEWAEDAEELLAVAQLYLARGEREAAGPCLRRGLELARLPATRRKLLAALARELRREGRRGDAAALWELHRREFPHHNAGWLELAKYHEHVTGDLASALAHAEAVPRPDQLHARRLERLRARLLRRSGGAGLAARHGELDAQA
jgi:uncharacterized protein YprB with RNaseH-like and TPR domain